MIFLIPEKFMLLSNEMMNKDYDLQIQYMFKITFIKMPPGCKISQCAEKFQNSKEFGSPSLSSI